MVNRLRELIRRYSASEIGYGEFRNEFVRFLSASDQDLLVERLYNSIEGYCAAFEHGHVNEVGLKLKLQRIFPVSIPVQQNASAFKASDFVVVMPNVVGVRVAFAGNNAFQISSPASNQPHDEPELEPALVG